MTHSVNGVSVLVIGDANPDLVLTGDVVPRFGQSEQLLDAAELVLGGSAAIVACGLARLGVPTALAAVVGPDAFGDLVLARLTAAGVRTTHVERRAAPTGLSVILDRRDDRAILTLPGTIALLSADAVGAAVEDLRPRHVHVASYFLQPGLAVDLPELLGEIRRRGVTTSLDTNDDPTGGWSGLAPVLAETDVAFPNRQEAVAMAGALTGRPGWELAEAAAVLNDCGPRVVIKDGAAGGLAYEGGQLIGTAPGLAVEVVDTTGAGDSFDAGYLAAMINGIDDESTRLRWAAVAGSLSTRGAGGTARQADRTELEASV